MAAGPGFHGTSEETAKVVGLFSMWWKVTVWLWVSRIFKKSAKLYMKRAKYFYRQMTAGYQSYPTFWHDGMMSSPEFTLEKHAIELQKQCKNKISQCFKEADGLCWAVSLGRMWTWVMHWTWLKAIKVKILCSDVVLTHFGIITYCGLSG